MKEVSIANIGYGIRSILDQGEVKDCIKTILTSLLQQFKEIKGYNFQVLEKNNQEKFFGNIIFDFQDMINIVLAHKTGENLRKEELRPIDITKIKNFGNSYFDNSTFYENVAEMTKNFTEKMKNNQAKLRIKSIEIYFSNMPSIMLNLKLTFNFLVNKSHTILPIILSVREKEQIVYYLYTDKSSMIKKEAKLPFIIKKVEELNLKSLISQNEISFYIKKITESAKVKQTEQEKKHTQQIPKKNYPRPMFNYEIKESKGIVKVINKILSRPTGILNITAYKGTTFENNVQREIFEQKTDKFLIKPFFEIANDLSNIFNNTDKLLAHLKIDKSVLSTHKATQKNIFINFYMLDKKISDFFYKFFQDVKSKGIYYTQNKSLAFYQMCQKIVVIFKNSVYNSALNYYTNSKEIVKTIGCDTEKIEYFLNMIGVELSGVFMNINRGKKVFETPDKQ